MLSRNDVHWLSGELAATAEAMGHVLSENAIVVMGGELLHYTKPQLQVALARTRAETSGRLTLNTVLQRLDAGVGRLGPEEAWAVALAAMAEQATVVWNDEVQQAWSTCQELMRHGDKIGARMAFKQAYERITQDNRVSKVNPTPLVSVGWDRDLKIKTITQAYEQGRLPLEQAKTLLAGESVVFNEGQAVVLEVTRGPAIDYDPRGKPFKTDRPALALGHLLTGPATVAVSPEVMERLRAAAIKGGKKAVRRKAALVRLNAWKLKKAKEATDQATQSYLSSKGGQA